ncbi:hypothetical protein KIPB_004082, partial [Kipferlia bialata]|eukprot:g4082.t1
MPGFLGHVSPHLRPRTTLPMAKAAQRPSVMAGLPMDPFQLCSEPVICASNKNSPEKERPAVPGVRPIIFARGPAQ